MWYLLALTQHLLANRGILEVDCVIPYLFQKSIKRKNVRYF